jgi:uncharacterized protein YndB with AHSA1/START domain
MAKVELDAIYPCSVDKVWAALSDPGQLADWYMRPEGFHPAVGTKFRLYAKPNPFFKGLAYCEVLAVEPPHLIRWSQSEQETGRPTFTLTWTLTPEGEGTRLRLLQDGLSGLRGQMIKLIMGAGWKRLLQGRLPGLLAMR